VCESTGHGKRERQTAEATPSRHFPASKPGGNGALHATCETASLLVERYLFSRLRVFRQGVNRYWKNCIERLFIRLLQDKVVFPGPWLQDCAPRTTPHHPLHGLFASLRREVSWHEVELYFVDIRAFMPRSVPHALSTTGVETIVK